MIMADADGAIKWVVIDWEKKDGEVLSSVLVEALPVGKITLKLKEKKVGGAAIMMAKDSTASKETNLWEGKIIGLFANKKDAQKLVPDKNSETQKENLAVDGKRARKPTQYKDYVVGEKENTDGEQSVPKSKPSKKSSKVDRILKTSNDYTKENDLKVLNDVNKASELERNCRKESELNFIKKMKDLEQSSVHASSQFENVALMPKHQFDCHVSPSTDENNFSIDIVQECADIMSATTQVSPSPIKETKKINKSTSNRSLFVPSNSHLNPTKEQESAITITKSLVQKEMPAKKLIPTSPTSCTHPKFISTPKHTTTGMKRPKSSIDKTSEERPRVGMKRPRNQPIVADENCEKCKEYIESIIKLQRENSKLKEALEAFQKESDAANELPRTPRPGRMTLEMAEKFQMKQLAPPRHVFIYESHMIGVESRQEPSSKACYLLSVFFPNEELIGTNLTGANNKKGLDSDIIGAIVDYCVANGGKASTIKSTLRNKITAIKAHSLKAKKMSLQAPDTV